MSRKEDRRYRDDGNLSDREARKAREALIAEADRRIAEREAEAAKKREKDGK